MGSHRSNTCAYLISCLSLTKQIVVMFHSISVSTNWFFCIVPSIPLHLIYTHAHVYVHVVGLWSSLIIIHSYASLQLLFLKTGVGQMAIHFLCHLNTLLNTLLWYWKQISFLSRRGKLEPPEILVPSIFADECSVLLKSAALSTPVQESTFILSGIKYFLYH